MIEESVIYQDIIEKGLQQGLQQGVQQGLEQGLQQGLEQGLQQGEKKLLMRLLTRRFGKLSPKVCKQIESLEVEKVEDLAEVLLDFKTKAELIKWFNEK